ncbi:alpha-amylase family glycosyl hydrolase [Neobacillus sp. D3-1R]|uniref:alpha-amylase family glycosyl hydrolase n=1 Tax=Neobacillus sp. D3-1R TaxID=3445778 RepID=UPI003FA0EEDF
MKKFALSIIALFLVLTGCQSQKSTEKEKSSPSTEMVWSKDQSAAENTKHRVYYEIFVRAFADSNGDGIGDLNGVTKQLDYLKELGVGGIWLMPINPSPSYHGYDVTDYMNVNKDYGTLEDMKNLVSEAHKRDIKVVMDLVMNHTSKEHPWFQKALIGDPKYRDYYVWSDETTNTNAVGDWNQKIWHGTSDQKYEAIFWDGMPDLNYKNPAVMTEMKNAGQFWLSDIGIDGFRLDAAKYLISSHQSATNHEDNAKLWSEFKQATQQAKPDSILIGEIWDSASIVGKYLTALDSGFDFDLSTKILSSVKGENDAGIASSLERTRGYFQTVSPTYMDSIFITNHDMNRVMSELNGDVNHAKMAASLLLTLPGNPFLYYGEEIGLEGKKPDEHIREPMIWTPSEEDAIHSKWVNHLYSKNRDEVAVSVQENEKDSLLNHYKTMIAVRNSHPTLMDGEIKASAIRTKGLVSFERVKDDSRLLVLHNVSKDKLTITLPEDMKDVYFSSESYVKKGKELTLSPYSTIIFEAK